jgi:hypothetical protein
VKHKVSWDKVCSPKSEGGLGIRRLDVWNCAAMLNHMESVYSSRFFMSYMGREKLAEMKESMAYSTT